jgi:hypothetical protein
VVGETARTVHVIALTSDGRSGVVRALCGAALTLTEMDMVTPGEGMPCMACVLDRISGAAEEESPAGHSNGDLQEWDWPVTLHCGQLRLSLGGEVSAYALPAALGASVTRILSQRRCAPAVLSHPDAPDHRIVLTGERYGVALPPTDTPRGSITWIHSPQADSLRRCREIDLFGALRTALCDSSPEDAPP